MVSKLIVFDNQVKYIDEMEALIIKKGYPYRKIDRKTIKSRAIAESRRCLRTIGIEGEVIQTFGHGDQGIALLLDTGEALIGDLPTEYEYDESVKADWDNLYSKGAKYIYPAHAEYRGIEEIKNINILPSEKLQSLKSLVSGKQIDEKGLRVILDGTYLCTNCHRCTDVCPAGINLEELWFAMREDLFDRGYPEFSVLSPLSFYRGLMREHIPPEQYKGPLVLARDRIAADCELMKDQSKPVHLTPAEGEFQGALLLSDQASTFSACFGCQTCTNVCPVVANYANPKEALGMLPHQIMYSVGLGIKDLAFGSNMVWDCVTCYQCQEQCPQGVHVTEVLYELKNLAIKNVMGDDIPQRGR